MPDYKRFIAYFYEYIDGKRQRNAGFVKAEQRNGVWKLRLQLKAKRWPQERVEIYGYYVEKGAYLKTVLSVGYVKKEDLIQNLQIKSDRELINGKTFETLDGMWIPCGEQRGFLSHWAEGEAEIEKLTAKNEKTQNSAEIEIRMQEAEISKIEMPAPETVPGGITETLTNQEEDLNWENPPKLRREPQEFLEDMKKIVRMPEAEAVIGEVRKIEQERERTDQEMQLQIRRSQIWQQMKNSHLKIRPFPEDECIVICPKDILWMNRQGWAVSRSNFSMEGFSQYHHLLLGKGKNDTYIIGVPGIQTAESERKANVFGYKEFRKASQNVTSVFEKDSDWKKQEKETFGYWCRNI